MVLLDFDVFRDSYFLNEYLIYTIFFI